MPDLRPILLVSGILLSILAATMLIPALVDFAAGNIDWQSFVISAFITAFVGMSLFLTNRGYEGTLTLKQAFLLTATSWCIVTAFAALPMYFSEYKLSYTDAYFEAMSGITTTGSTVIAELDHAPPGLLLWRAILCGLGGIGIVVLGLAVLPMLRIGGMQLFRTESSDNMDKLFPRTAQIANMVTSIFLIMVALCALCYWLAGMDGFDAICHAIPTVATAGFANYDSSFQYWDSSLIEGIAIVFMLAGALPLMLYYQAVRENPMVIFRNSQVRWYFAILAGVTALLSFWLMYEKNFELEEAVRHSAFNVVSIMTTTGFVSTDYAIWGHFSTMLLFMLTVIGGCTGSTAGGIKIFRYQVLYETAKVQIKQLLQPHGVFIPQYNGKPIPEGVTAAVLGYFILFAFCFMVLSIMLSFMDIDFLTSMSGVAQAMANVGPGLGHIIGPAGNFSTMPDGAKWILSFAMILGRLELFTILVLFSPSFWRD